MLDRCDAGKDTRGSMNRSLARLLAGRRLKEEQRRDVYLLSAERPPSQEQGKEWALEQSTELSPWPTTEAVSRTLAADLYRLVAASKCQDEVPAMEARVKTVVESFED